MAGTIQSKLEVAEHHANNLRTDARVKKGITVNGDNTNVEAAIVANASKLKSSMNGVLEQLTTDAERIYDIAKKLDEADRAIMCKEEDRLSAGKSSSSVPGPNDPKFSSDPATQQGKGKFDRTTK